MVHCVIMEPKIYRKSYAGKSLSHSQVTAQSSGCSGPRESGCGLPLGEDEAVVTLAKLECTEDLTIYL